MGAAAGEGGRRRQEGTGPPPRENSHVAGATTQVKILVPGDQSMVALLGQRDVFLKIIESAFDCRILVRGNEITVSGRQEEAEQVARIFEELLALLEKGHDLTDSSVDQTIALVKGDDVQPGDADIRPSEVLGDRLLTARGKGIAPRTMGQKRFVDAIRSNTVTFVIGPAGTGKTYLAVATAVKALQEHQVSRLILTRPAVEAGERLGYLPGTLYEKIDPYMRPLYDALFEMTGAETLPRLMERGTVEVAPLAFMRGGLTHGIELVRKGTYDYVLKRAGGSRGGVIVANPVTTVLRELGLAGTRSNTKFVPDSYRYNSAEVRHAVLQGLLDTDGGPVTQARRSCRVQYTTTSPQLRDDVLFLVRSLGGIAYARTRAAEGRPPGRAKGRAVLLSLRRLRARHPAPRTPSAVPPHEEGGHLSGVRWRWPPDAVHRQHRTGGHGGDRVHPGRGPGFAVRHRRLPRDPQHLE